MHIDHIVDEAPLKHNKFIAGTSHKIEKLDIIGEIKGPVLFIVGAWNFYTELKDKLGKIRSRVNQDKITKYFPRLMIESL